MTESGGGRGGGFERRTTRDAQRSPRHVAVYDSSLQWRQSCDGWGAVLAALAALAAASALVAGCSMPILESGGQAASGQEEPAASGPGEPGDTRPEEAGAESEPVAPGGGPGGEAELAVADVSAVERDGRLGFPVSLSGGSGVPVTVAYASEDGTARADSDYVAVSGTLTFAGESAETKEIEVQVLDDKVHEGEETLTLRLSGAQGAKLTEAAGTGTIVDDDRRAVAVYPVELNVEEGGAGSYTVVLGTRPAGPVTVTVEETEELTARPRQVEFGAADWRTGRTVTVTAAEDEDALGDAPVELGLVASGGGYDGEGAAVRVTIVENDVTTLAAGAGRAVEGEGRMGFEVSVSLAGDEEVTVNYATADATAEAGADYTAVGGTLTFPAGSREARTVEVVVRDDSLDEAEEEFALRLSNAVHAELAGGGASTTATGTIIDDDPAPELTIAGAGVTEGGGALGFAVRLEPASGRTVTVTYATVDGTAAAGADYTAVSGGLTLAAGATTRTIAVPVVDDQTSEETETFTVTLHDARGATLTDATATGTITDNDEPEELELSSLQVIAIGPLSLTMYPAFDPDIHHYALPCTSPATLQVTAVAKRSGATLTLLREDSDNNQTATGSLHADVIVSDNEAVVIRLTDTDGTATYVVHCLPGDFPTLSVLPGAAAPTGGLLFITIPGYYAIVDYNGVPRFRSHTRINKPWASQPKVFRPHSDGPVVRGKRVKYSVIADQTAILLDADFQQIRAARPPAGPPMDPHDFVLGMDSFFFISYVAATHDFRIWDDDFDEPVEVQDSVISEVSFAGDDAGSVRKEWNSWDHLKIVPDCVPSGLPGEYAHLNALQLVDGDIIASFRGCSQVVRIDRSSGTWALQWQLGGTDPPRSSDTEYLEIVGDPLGEFCGQHHATLTDSGRLVLFDNGVECLGSRKDSEVVTRVVEYDLSSGTEARFIREYRRAAGHGISEGQGGATVLDNGNWLIAWGTTEEPLLPAAEIASVTEVAPDGTAVFQLNATGLHGSVVTIYRAYHDHEANVSVPLNLP